MYYYVFIYEYIVLESLPPSLFCYTQCLYILCRSLVLSLLHRSLLLYVFCVVVRCSHVLPVVACLPCLSVYHILFVLAGLAWRGVARRSGVFSHLLNQLISLQGFRKHCTCTLYTEDTAKNIDSKFTTSSRGKTPVSTTHPYGPESHPRWLCCCVRIFK